ncbi:MAG: undecaprenyl-diphosphatase UppP [Anaerolineae bacterium]|nr:undecaprenyl-diphosphatase UppP [Anaerolineae bacterium]
MSLLQALILGVLQGATEFLPVSSSAHLVLVPWLMRWQPPGLAFDTIVHWGTAMAVVVYFWREWAGLIRAAGRSLTARANPDSVSRLPWLILIGTLPAAIIGYLWDDFFEEMFARPVATAGFLLLTALLLSISEYLGKQTRALELMNARDALLIGLAQALAIFPGISRSGATIAAGLARGLERESAARFSFLIATPIIIGAGVFKLWELTQSGGLATRWPMLAVGFAGAATVGWVCIHFLLRYLRQRRLYPFAIYCAAAGLCSLLVALLRG